MKFTKKVLDNGLRIITVPMKDNPTVSVMVLVEAGSKYETKSINGLSHFVEHICFKGTTKRPKAIDITKELDGLGSQYNASTSHEFTAYYAKSEAKHFDKLIDIISDIYLNPNYDEQEINKERGVIIEEINMYQDAPQHHVQDLFMELLYGDQPAGWNIAGTKANIKKIKRSDFLKYCGEHYVAKGTVVVVAGHINEKEVWQAIREKFKDISKKKKHGKVIVKDKQARPAVKIKYKKTDQTHLVLGVRTYDLFDKRLPALGVLSVLLGGSMSSRLFQKLREELGVCYYVSAFNDSYTDHGFLEIKAGVDNKRIKEVLQAILLELKRLKESDVSEEELSRVKEYIIGNTNLELESSDSIAQYFGIQEVLKKKVMTPKENIDKIRQVTAKDIKAVARDIFKGNKLNLALIGPNRDEKIFKSILKL